MYGSKNMKKISFIALLTLATACATPANKGGDNFADRDPAQPVNERIFAFNLAVDGAIVKPISEIYHAVIPAPVREGVSNVISNLGEPLNVANNALQLNVEGTFTSFWRFVLNTTFGLGGLRDFAGENGLKEKDTNFGKTLAKHGAAEGNYVVLPLIGPSTTRDTAGKIVDWVMDPIGWLFTTPETVAQVVTGGVSDRNENAKIINQFYYESLDPYSATRAAYLQHQAFQK